MELKLQLEQQNKGKVQTSLYLIVAGCPVKSGKEIELYLAPIDLSDVISYAKASTLDETVPKLFQEAIDRLDEHEKTKPDFLGWPVSFTSFGFVQAGGGDFFGWEPFPLYPIPQETLLKFAQLYAARVKEAKSQFHRK